MLGTLNILKSDFEKIRLEGVVEILKEELSSEEVLFEKKLTETEEGLILRKIFDVSREFGLSLKEKKQANYSFKEISEFIKQINTPCFRGTWNIDDTKAELSRLTCQYKNNNSFACLYWREAIDGFVMGVGEDERYSRLKSLFYGKNNECLDVFYDSKVVNVRWIDVSEDIANIFSNIEKKLQEKQVSIDVLGMAEKTVYFKLKDSNENLKQFRHKYLIDSIKRNFSEKLPNIELFEISPRAVIEDSF